MVIVYIQPLNAKRHVLNLKPIRIPLGALILLKCIDIIH